jgi:hypothetical protein
MGPAEEQTIAELLEQERHILSAARTRIKKLADQRDPQIGPELTLALRHIEDARMRLGVAAALSKGLDPWSSEVQEKVGEQA